MKKDIKILVVDDDEMIRNFFKATATALKGILLQTAQNGLEALAILQNRGSSFDVILSDKDMLRINEGIELIMKGKKYAPNARFYLMTGKLADDFEKQALEAGAEGVLQKPFLPLNFFLFIQE